MRGSGVLRLLLTPRVETLAQGDIDHLDHHRERHGEIQHGLWHMHLDGLADQRHTHEDEEAEGQHLDRGVAATLAESHIMNSTATMMAATMTGT